MHSNNEDIKSFGTIALLNLPVHTSLSLDASAAQILRQEEPLIVIRKIHPLSGFHLLVVRPGSNSTNGSLTEANFHNSAVLILFDGEDEAKNDWFLARKYNIETEEISSQPLDQCSFDNLKRSIDDKNYTGTLNPSRLITYDAFTRKSSLEQSGWDQHLTQYISRDVLQRHGLSGKGDKIIPSMENCEDETLHYQTSKNDESEIESTADGFILSFPPIPCINLQEKFLLHSGTKRFLAELPASERTALFLKSTQSEGPQSIVFHKILKDYYNSRWDVLFGEWQLSFVTFLCCSCLSSLEHWRDMLTMLSLVEISIVDDYPHLYENLLITLKYQLTSYERGLFEDMDYSNDNFLLPTVKQLCLKCFKLEKNQISLSMKAREVYQYVSQLNSETIQGSNFQLLGDGELQASNIHVPESDKIESDTSEEEEEDEEDDEDGPTIVVFDEVEASIARSSSKASQYVRSQRNENVDQRCHAKNYPLLFASMMDHEDVLMTCARILDEKVDVSLVREAAAYLENVEAN